MKRFSNAAILLASLVLLTPAAPGKSFGQAAQFRLIDGSVVEGVLESISPEGELRGDGLPEGLQLDQISMVTRRQSPAESTTPFIVKLVGGSRINAQSVTSQNDRYRVQAASLEFSVGAEAIHAIIRRERSDSSLLNRLLGEPDHQNDRVIAQSSRGEQAVAGLLEEIQDQRIGLEYRGQSRSIVMNKIVAIILADLQQTLPAGTRVRINLVDGSLAVATLLGMKNNELRLGLAGNNQAVVSWDQVARMAVQSDRVSYLSERQPTDVVQRAFASTSFDYQVNRNVFGEPMTLYDDQADKFVEYPRGLGTHSYCRLEYRIDGDSFSRLKALVGLDRRSKHQGDCLVSVTGDGIELWSARIQGNQAPRRVDVDVEGVETLALVVEPGKHLDMGDHVNWVNARLVRID